MSSIDDKVTDFACTTARTILRCLIFRIKGHVIFQLDVNKNEKEFVFFSPTKYGLTGFCAPVFKELLFKRSGQEHFCRYLGCFILDVEVRWRLDSFFFSFHLTCLPMTVAWFGGDTKQHFIRSLALYLNSGSLRGWDSTPRPTHFTLKATSYSVGPHGSLVFVVQRSTQMQLQGQPEAQETLYVWRHWSSNHRGDILPYSE